MRHVKLGSAGLEVSAIALGSMSYGDASLAGHQWVLDEPSSRPFFAAALDARINFFDMANMYSGGSEEGLEVDAYWAAIGGADVAALLPSLGERVRFLHVKDAPLVGDGPLSKDRYNQLPVCEGALVWQHIFAAATAAELYVVGHPSASELACGEQSAAGR